MPSFRLLIALLMAAATIGAARQPTTSGRQILIDGEPLQVRGVCYQPTPIGDNPSQSPPYGDYFTTSYAAIHDRDLANLRAMGANVIRVYGWSTTDDHTAFLDKCWNGGVAPIRVLVNRWINPFTDWSSSAAVAAITKQFTDIDSRLGDHPAVLGIVLGNEANIQNGNGTNPAFWTAMNTIAGAIKAQTPGRLVSMAITDAVPQIAARDAAMDNLDFWCVQVYRGTTFGTFFTEYAAASSKPLILTEFGIDAYDHQAGAPYPDNGAFVAGVAADLWAELVANADIASGACYFEYLDEWWKGGSASAHDTGGFAIGGFPDGFANEEWWGLFSVARGAAGQPDALTPRATYETLQTLWTAAEVEPPAITAQPASVTATAGTGVTLTVTATGEGPLSYQWRRNGVPIDGATSPTLEIPSLQAYMAAEYTVEVTNAGGSVVSAPATLAVEPAAPSESRLLNISSRGFIGTGESIMIPGFVISSEGPKTLLVRAAGPALAALGVEGALPDPILKIFREGENDPILVNDDWGENGDGEAIAAAAGQLGAFTFPEDSADAALVVTLAPGAYTVQASDAGGATGVGLVEVYLLE